MALGTPRRILILCKFFTYGFGGTPEAVLLLARALKAADILTDVNSDDGFVEDAGALDDLPLTPNVLSAHTMRRIEDYEALIVAGAWMPRALPLAWAARRTKVPVIYSPKGQLCRIEFRRVRDLKKLAYLCLAEIWMGLLANRIQFTSRLEQRFTLLPSGLKTRKALILPEPVEGVRLGGGARAARDAGAPLRFGFIAQISPRKGLQELVEGFLHWRNREPQIPAELLIAGTAIKGSEAYLERIEELLAQHPAGVQVRFLGQVSGEARNRFYETVDILVVPSLFESYCLTVPEGLWHGCAVIAGPVIGVLEFLPHQTALRVLPEVSASAIAEALRDAAAEWPGLATEATGQWHKPLTTLEGGVARAGIGSVLAGA